MGQMTDQGFVQPAMGVAAHQVAFVVSRYNQTMTQVLWDGAHDRWRSAFKVPDDQQPEIYWVPGAVEIPWVAQQLCQRPDITCVVTLGVVMRGETTHYDYVCDQVSQGCQQVMLASKKPIIFGVLTTENEAQTWDRLGGAHGHKGVESVDAAIEMMNLSQQFKR